MVHLLKDTQLHVNSAVVTVAVWEHIVFVTLPEAVEDNCIQLWLYLMMRSSESALLDCLSVCLLTCPPVCLSHRQPSQISWWEAPKTCLSISKWWWVAVNQACSCRICSVSVSVCLSNCLSLCPVWRDGFDIEGSGPEAAVSGLPQHPQVSQCC